jgi:hypothetical protein
MSKKVPNIKIAKSLGNVYRKDFRELILKVLTDTFLFEFRADELELLGDVFFQLTLKNKRFLIDTLQVDTVVDYIDVYLYSVKQPQTRYRVSVIGNDIIITFVENITRVPKDVKVEDFRIIGKIAEVE